MVQAEAKFDAHPVYIVDGARTPFLQASGRTGPFSAADLAVAAARPLLVRQPFSIGALDEVIIGNTLAGLDYPNIARTVTLRLGRPADLPGYTVNRHYGTGVQVIHDAAIRIMTGRADLILAGATESMSRRPLLPTEGFTELLGEWRSTPSLTERLRLLLRLQPSYLKPVDPLRRGQDDPASLAALYESTEEYAIRFAIDRNRMDAWAADSHQRAARASELGYFSEVEPIFSPGGHLFDADQRMQTDLTADALSRRRPLLRTDCGSVTAGNSARAADGAAWLLLASEAAVTRHNLPVLGRLADVEWSALPPEKSALAALHAMTPLLNRHGFHPEDIDRWEIDETSAATALICGAAWRSRDYCRQALGLDDAFGDLDPTQVNVDGGAIAVGRPIAASGVRLALHLLHVLNRDVGKHGVAAVDAGSGLGGAIMLEGRATL